MADPSQGAASPQPLVYWWAPRGKERVFDLAGWPDEARAALQALLDAEDTPHRWEGSDLVVDAAQRDDVTALLDAVVEASLPRLDADSDRTAYDLADWPDYELEVLAGALEDEGILHEWTEDGELLVHEVDEARVDELFERLDLRGPDPGIELDGEALTGLLTTLFVAADRLTDDADDADAVLDAHAAILEVSQLAVPYGMNPDGWQVLVADAAELRRLIEADAGGTSVRTGDPRDPAGDDGADGEAVADAVDSDGDVDEDVDGNGPLGGGSTELFGDDAIKAVAGRVRDHLRRLL